MKLRFDIGNVYTSVKSDSVVPKELVDLCSFSYKFYFRKKGMRHAKAVQKTACYFDYYKCKFPSGWVGRISRELVDLGVDVEVNDGRAVPGVAFQFVSDWPDAVILRDYQKMAVVQGLSSTRGVIQHPTGAGKTVVAARLIAKKGLNAMYMVPNKLLLVQTIDKLSELLGRSVVGRMGGGVFKPKAVNVATVATLWRRRDDQKCREVLDRTNMLLIDECHHVGKSQFKLENTWFKVAMACQAFYRFGFSATPGEESSSMDNWLLSAVTGGVIHKVGVQDLVRDGFLVAPKVYIVQVRIPERLPDLFEAYKKYITTNEDRNKKIQEIATAEALQGRKTLILVDRVEDHGKILHGLISGSRFLHGGSKRKDRENLLREFVSGSCDVMIGTIFGEGFDFPALDTVIMAGGGKGGREGRKVVQQIGRVLRKSEGKEAKVFDFFDNDGIAGRHGMLGRHAKKRMSIYKEEGYEIIFQGKEE